MVCGYSCRIKRIEQIDELEGEKSQEYRDMEVMEEENGAMRLQLQALQARYSALKKFAMSHNIPIPHELDWVELLEFVKCLIVLASLKVKCDLFSKKLCVLYLYSLEFYKVSPSFRSWYCMDKSVSKVENHQWFIL